MANITVNMTLKERPAIYVPRVDRPKLNLVKGTPINVGVLGIYQVADEDDVDAYFVVVLPGGKCTYAGVEDIEFKDVTPEC